MPWLFAQLGTCDSRLGDALPESVPEWPVGG